jgi:hypothetical protein
MSNKSRRKFLKSISAASLVSAFGPAAFMSPASTSAAALQGAAALATDSTLGIVGDEITAKFYYVSPDKLAVKYMANGYITWALALAGQRLRIASNQASAGATVTGTDASGFIAQMQACINDGVSDIICMGGKNDLQGGKSLAAVKSAWTDAINLAVNNGKRVWWLTQTPLDNAPSDVRANIVALNSWILEVASQFSQVVAIDVAAAVSTSATYPAWKAKYSSDHVTPINIGAYFMGKEIARVWNQALPDVFALATDPLDDIQGDPRSFNIVHNSMFTQTGVASFSNLAVGANYTKDFDLVFSGGVGNGALATARVSNGAVVSIDIVNSGSYSEAPTVSFEKGDGSGAAAVAHLGMAGFTSTDDTSVVGSAVRTDGHGNDAIVQVKFPAWQAPRGLKYLYTMNRDIVKHIGPNDSFAIRCEITREAPQDIVNDKLTAVGPVIKCFGASNLSFESCAYSSDDLPLPEAFTAVMLTPPARTGPTKYISLSLNAANDNSYVQGATGTFKVGRFSCLVQPSLQITAVSKGMVKFNPGHYCFIYADWTYANFAQQDSFNTAVVGTLQTSAAWRGIEKGCYWRNLEPSKGVYNFGEIDAWLVALGGFVNNNGFNVKKRLIVYLLSDSYNRPANVSFPDYILQDLEYEGGVYAHSQGKGFKAKYFNKFVQDRLIALGQAIAARYDGHELFEAYRMDETSPGDTLNTLYPARLTDYVEGQVRIAAEINRAFKQTMFVMGFNYLADQKDTRAARLFIQAGVGMGGVDLVQSDSALAGQFKSYDMISSASPYVPSLIHFDGGNYMSNQSLPQDVSTVPAFAVSRLRASHISWYRTYPSTAPSNYANLTAYLNTLHTQPEWESPAYCTGVLVTDRAAAIQ